MKTSKLTPQTQMALWGNFTGAVEERYAGAMHIEPRYQFKRTKVKDPKTGKNKSVIVKDAKGAPVLKLDAAGNPIIASQSMVLIPRRSKTKDDMSDLTGLEGRDLANFAETSEEEFSKAGWAANEAIKMAGTHKLVRYTVNAAGDIAQRWVKKSKIRMTEAELIAYAAEQYGLELAHGKAPAEVPDAPSAKELKGAKSAKGSAK